jgi:hypothetical protein
MNRLLGLLLAAALISPGLLYTDEPPVLSVTPYGYIKLDAVYETGSSSHGNFAFWAANPGETSGLFHATANQTRLGLKIAAGKLGSFTLGGVVELDFYGGNAENKAYNYMRHAYLEMKNESWTFIAGQYWDIINPLNPVTLNYPVLWGSGNLGYRRAQISAHHRLKAGKALITLQAGIFRTISGDLDSDGIDDGLAKGLPSIQGRIAVKVPFGETAFMQVGISGHTGDSAGKVEYKGDSINVDMTLAFCKNLTLLGEWFSGRNMAPFMAGILQGVNTTAKESIETTGFYLTLQAGLTKALKLNLGYGLEDPQDETLASGNRSKNQTLFGNLILALNKSVSAGFEVYQVSTDYLNAVSQDTVRFQHSWTLSF